MSVRVTTTDPVSVTNDNNIGGSRKEHVLLCVFCYVLCTTDENF